MKKTKILVAIIATFMMMFTSSTAKAVDKRFVGMLPQNPQSSRNLTVAEYIAYLTKSEVPADILKNVYVSSFGNHISEYSALANQQVKARVQAIKGLTTKMTDAELIDYLNTKTGTRPVSESSVVSTATVIDEDLKGQVIGHGMAVARAPRKTTDDKKVEYEIYDLETGQTISFLTCVNTCADDVKQVTAVIPTPKVDSRKFDEGAKTLDELKADQKEQIDNLQKFTTNDGRTTIIFSPIMYQNQGGATATVTPPAATSTETIGIDPYANVWGKPVPVDRGGYYEQPEVIQWKEKVKKCYDCDDSENKILLAEILRQQKKTKRIAIADLVFDIANLGVSTTHFGMWLSGVLKGRKGSDSIGTIFGSGGDGPFVNSGIISTGGGFGSDAGIVY